MKKKTRKKLDEATLANVKKELAKPRMARSACKEEVNLNTARITLTFTRKRPGLVHGSIFVPNSHTSILSVSLLGKGT